jgi:hypothetical protein
MRKKNSLNIELLQQTTAMWVLVFFSDMDSLGIGILRGFYRYHLGFPARVSNNSSKRTS